MTIHSYAKVNIFLKIIGLRGNYHELSSRFVRVNNLYDTLSFEKKDQNDKNFSLIGSFSCKTEQNTIFKAYTLLQEYTNSKVLKDFFHTHHIVVEKNIPEFAGLGGGSSNAAAFLRLCNNICDPSLDNSILSQIGAQIGADVPFFIHNYPSANVSGIGENVIPFEEKPLDIETFTPDIKCDTTAVYQAFRKNYIKNIDKNNDLAQILQKQNSTHILQTYHADILNDLFPAAMVLYPNLKKYHKEGWFFSGSGSTFFTIGQQ